MSDEIKVHVVKRKDRKFLYLRYIDPVTGEAHERSSKCVRKKEANKAAGRWESELRTGGGVVSSRARTKWDAFRASYEAHVDRELGEKTLEKVWSLFNVIDRFMKKPDNVQRVTRPWINRFRTVLLEKGRQPSTIESHCRHLRAALVWAKEEGLIEDLPKFPKPSKKARKKKKMKGRPITGEEFDRYLAAVEPYFRKLIANRRRLGEKPSDVELSDRVRQSIDSVKRLMQGIWLSGLRLGEALSLNWDRYADGIRVDADGKFVKLLIFAEDEKGGQDRNYPVAPEFAEFLLSVPAAERKGHVFDVVLHRGICRRVDTVSSKLVDIGEFAGIKVDEKTDNKTGESKPVYASAHDLRRSFGTRWAKRGLPIFHLKELMRHASVQTTQEYYIDIESDDTAEAVMNVFRGLKSDTLSDTGPETASKQLEMP